MPYPYDFHPLAEEELFEIIDYLDGVRSGYGSLFAELISDEIELIISHPGRYPSVNELGTIRKAILPKPFHKAYSIYFEFQDDKILFISIFNNSRNPDEWQNR
ncbi:MAG: type II toxin-antitoxin system RelE/ParE family toxin [Bacteroidota bacterium]